MIGESPLEIIARDLNLTITFPSHEFAANRIAGQPDDGAARPAGHLALSPLVPMPLLGSILRMPGPAPRMPGRLAS